HPELVEDEMQVRDVAVPDERLEMGTQEVEVQVRQQPPGPRAAAGAEDSRHLVVREEAVQVGEPLRGRARGVDVTLGDGVSHRHAESHLLEALDATPQAAGIDGPRRRADAEEIPGTERAGSPPAHSTRRVAPPSTAMVVP